MKEISEDFSEVKVNGKSYETYIDGKGIQRFFDNSCISWLIDEKIIDLNRLEIAYQSGKFNKKDYAEVIIKSGYSVSGFISLSSFQDMKIENTLWENDER